MTAAEVRRCHACGGIMIVDDVTAVGGVIITTTFACEGCASVALVLSAVGYGALLGSTLVSLIAAVVFALSKEAHGWVASAFAVGLAAFFGFLTYLRYRDQQRNPRAT